MGLYGSPDLSKKYGNKEELDRGKKSPNWIKRLLWIIVVINTILLPLAGVNKENAITLLVLDSILIFAVNTVNMIYNLVKKRSAKNSMITMFIAIGIFLLAITELGKIYPSQDAESNNVGLVEENKIVEENELGTRKKPAKIGDIQQGRITDARGLDCEIEIELLEVKKKDDAIEKAKDIYTYVELGENQEYLFAKFRVKNVKNNSALDLPFNFNWSNFSYATSDYRKYSYAMGLVSSGGLLEPVDLYEGAEHEGWICLYVEKNDSQPKAVFLDNLWFDL